MRNEKFLRSRGFLSIGVLFGVVIAAAFLLGIGGYFVFLRKYNNSPVACTQEARQCPDGSYVGRTGPNCEFAPCPSEALCEGGSCANVWTSATSTETINSLGGSSSIDTSSWQTYRNEKYGFEVRYPSDYVLAESDTFVSINVWQKQSPAGFDIEVLPLEKVNGYPTQWSDLRGYLNFINKPYAKKKIANVEWAETVEEDVEVYVRTLFTIKEGQLIQLGYFWLAPHLRSEYEGVFLQILSTFKFIPSTDSTSSPQAGSGQGS